MIDLNKQTERIWYTEIMTSANPLTDPQGRSWSDKLGLYGCLITSIANILQCIMKKKFTPKDLNDVLKISDGYNYLVDKNCKENEASFLNWDAFKKLFKAVEVKLNQDKKIFIKDDLTYYIARVLLNNNGHYINVLDKKGTQYICFDVWDGKTKIYDESEIYFLHELRSIV